jgi:topoisomerase IA-like protein
MPTLIEKHLNYVVNAMTSAQTRQQRLWDELDSRRDSKGIIPLSDPVLDEYCEAARMTASLMIDIEMVRDEYFAIFGNRPKSGRRKSTKKTAKKVASKAARKVAGKAAGKKAASKKAPARRVAGRKKAAARGRKA